MIIKVLIYSLICITVVITVLISIAMFRECYLTLELKRFYFEAYKAVGIGFLVGILGVMVPHILQEARDKFERFKDSRIAYSQAKTSVIYLPERLATLSFKDAVSRVQQAHQKLHLAETYKKELRKHLKWYPKPKIWSEQMYYQLYAVRETLQSRVDIWENKITAGARMCLLLESVELVENMYDEKGFKKLAEKNRKAIIKDSIKFMVKSQKLQDHVRDNAG